MSTFTLPSRQTFSFSPALRPVLLSFPLLRYHFPLNRRLVLLSLTTCLSSLFSPCPPPCLLIFPPLSTCLLTLFLPMHSLSFPSLFHSLVPLFFSFSFIITFPPFSVLPPTHILPFFHPLVYPLFFHPHTSFFLLSAPSTFSFSFSSLYSSRLFCSPFSFIPFLSYTHSHTSLSPLSPVLAFLTSFLFPLFSHSPPFLPRLPLPFPAKTILPDFSLRHKKTEGRSLPFFNRNNLLKKTISSVR